MKMTISSRYALRSLLRHKRRTLLSVIGIGVGCAVCLIMVSFVRGESEMMMRAAANSGTGHLRVASEEWLKTREKDLRLGENWRDLLADIREMDVAAAAPHARTDAFLAIGTRTAGVVMVGVDPAAEPKLNRLVRDVTEGQYLTPKDAGRVVIGRAIAKRLDVGVGDALMVTVSGKNGEMRGAMLSVAGIVATGSEELDAGVCHVLLAEVEEITGYEGAAEISILLKDHGRINAVAERLREMAGPGEVVVKWDHILPELASGVEVDETWTNLMVGLVVIVVFLGIASAQLAAVLERRKEFAVLSAIGMKGGQLVRIMLAEGAILGVAGALLALAVGLPLVLLLAEYGIDFSSLYGEADLAVSNVLIDPIIYGEVGWWLLPLAVGLSLIATTLSSLYPAWYALGTDPANALRVEQ